MIGKGRQIKPLTLRQLFSKKMLTVVNMLIEFYNAFTKGKIVSGSSNDLLISDNNILWQISGGTGTGNTAAPSQSDFQGVYVPGQTYNALDWVVVQNGTAAGSYISTADNNTNAPITGINWIQFSWLPQWF